MKLNIYEKKKVLKTYEVDKYDLMFGVVEDVADALDFDSLKTGNNAEIIKMVGNMVFKSMDTIKDLLKDVFEGLTDDELKNVKVSEIVDVIVEIVQFTILQLRLGAGKKN